MSTDVLDNFTWYTYDFEVFEKDWLVVFKEKLTGKYTAIWNDNLELKEWMDDRAECLFASFNGAHYDSWIMRAICTGCTPEEVKEVNDWIIGTDNQAWEHPYLQGVYYSYNDVDLFKDTQAGTSLKGFEGHYGMNIEESKVDFTVDHKLSDEERADVEKYCKADVDATEKLLEIRHDYLFTKATLAQREGLDIPKALSLTNAKLTAEVLKAERVEHNDERAYEYPTNLLREYVPPEIFEFFDRIHDMSVLDAELWSSSLEIDISGCPTTIAFGGIHGARRTCLIVVKDGWVLVIDDVGSYYPSLAIKNGYVSRNIPSAKLYEDIYHERLAAKKAGDKATANAQKLVLNTTYGATLDRYNKLYDPLQARSICISGQLYLVEFANHCVQDIDRFTLVQLNTDGIVGYFPESEWDKYQELREEWQTRTGFTLEAERISRLWQRDVNTYAMRFEDGHVKLKGQRLVRGISTAGAFKINNDAVIVAEAVAAYLLDGTLPIKTVMECNDPKKFQYIAKGGHKFNRVYQMVDGEEVTVQKCNRVFACKDKGLGTLYKVSAETGRPTKIAGLPSHCLICNEGFPDISSIDKWWYVDLANRQTDEFEGESMANEETTTTKPTRKRAASAKAAEGPDYKSMNVYQKLAIARRMFLDWGIKKSGVNRNLEFLYFELDDIVPAQTRIFEEVGLIEIFQFNPGLPSLIKKGADGEELYERDVDLAIALVVNADNPQEVIEFSCKWLETPVLVSNQGKKVTNELQELGKAQTYIRRYLKMQVLDVTEPDAFDAELGRPLPSDKEKAASATEVAVSAEVTTSTDNKSTTAKESGKTAQKPPTPASRKKTAKTLAGADGKASALQIKQLQKIVRTLMDTYAEDHPELGVYVTELGSKTNNLENITKAQCEQAIRELGEMKEGFES